MRALLNLYLQITDCETRVVGIACAAPPTPVRVVLCSSGVAAGRAASSAVHGHRLGWDLAALFAHDHAHDTCSMDAQVSPSTVYRARCTTHTVVTDVT